MANRLQLRRDTSTRWTSVNPILMSGEIGLETDTNKIKIGDGVKNWSQLDYFATGGGGSSEPEIFWATYGTTTAAQIQAALDAGKVVMCRYEASTDKIYMLDDSNSTAYEFHAMSATNYIYRVRVTKSASVWSVVSSGQLQVRNLVESASSDAPSDNNYYSALATKNLVDAVANSLETKISDAPSDGKAYVRKDEEWVEGAEKSEIEEIKTRPIGGDYKESEIVSFRKTDAVNNRYWNIVDGKAGLVAASGYYAKPELIEVNPGDEIICTVADSIAGAAYGGYDNDLNGFLSGAARVDFHNADKQHNNGDGTKTYTFVIKKNCTKVGLFYKTEEVAFTIKRNVPATYDAKFDEKVLSLVESSAGDVILSDYYLKGNSPKTLLKYPCILVAGQSNADGRCPYTDLPTEMKNALPYSDCMFVKNSLTGSFSAYNNTGNWAFDGVVYYYMSVVNSLDMYSIKLTQGGTSISADGDGTAHWTADYEDIEEGETSLLKDFEQEIRNHIASDGNNFDIKAVLWHQGEGDRNVANTYYEELKKLVSYIRGITGNSRLPFITGTISHNSSQYNATIEAAQIRLAEEDPYFYLVDMGGAPLQDSYHFNAAASVYFGEMVFNALIDYGVITASKLTPTRPW